MTLLSHRKRRTTALRITPRMLAAKFTALVALVADTAWQGDHQAALQDLPALRDAMARALDAAVADDTPAGLPLVVRAADACVQRL